MVVVRGGWRDVGGWNQGRERLGRLHRAVKAATIAAHQRKERRTRDQSNAQEGRSDAARGPKTGTTMGEMAQSRGQTRLGRVGS